MWGADLGVVVRRFARRPGVNLLVVAILAVGIGASTAIFSVVDTVLLEPLPYPRSDQLVAVWETNPALGRDRDGPSPANLLDWQERTRAFTGIAASHEEPVTVSAGGDARELIAARVTAGFFEVLGTAALYGRTLTAADAERQARVVVLAHRFHQQHLGGDPDVIGRDLLIEGETRRVVGVMPPELTHPDPRVQLWIPWSFEAAYAHRGGPPRDFRFLDVVARLRSDVSLARAQADLERVAAGLAAEHPETNAGWSARLVPLREEMVAAVDDSLWMLFGAVGFVLLASWANVSGLLLARAVERSKNVAIRRALGASRGSLVRLALAESAILALFGGLGGLGLSHGALKLLLAARPWDLPRLAEIDIDPRALGFALITSVLTALAVGCAPVLRELGEDRSPGLIAGGGRATAGRSHRLVRRLLVAAELAVALVLLAGGGLLVKSFATLRAVDPGFDPEGVLVTHVNLDRDAYDGGKAGTYFSRLLGRVAALPGVEAAGAVSALPLSPVAVDFDRPFWLPGQAPPKGERPEAAIRIATPGYLEALNMEIVEGRPFDERDIEGGLPVVIVNQTLTRRLWGESSPVGKQLVLDYRGVDRYRIVGVLRDSRFYGPRSPPTEEVYLPHPQVPYLSMSLAIRARTDPAALAEPVRRLALEIDPAQPVHSSATLESLVSASVARERFATGAFGFLAAVTATLASMGVYGLIVFSVRQRWREIGLRLALGAPRSAVLWMVLRESLALAVAGIALGLTVTATSIPALSHLLFGVEPLDPTTLTTACLLLLGIAALAGLLPATHATRVDPALVLREE